MISSSKFQLKIAACWKFDALKVAEVYSETAIYKVQGPELGLVTIQPEMHPFLTGFHRQSLSKRVLERIVMAEQNFSNHAKFFPLFHFFVVPLMVVNLVQQIVHWVRSEYSLGGFIDILVAIGLLAGFTAARMMALKVQDRVIRLEERLRMEKLLPADLQPRIPEFTTAQLVALRFASNSELPDLARKVLDEKVADRKAIKQMIKTWRPDFLRA
jgi:uncharacterized membrane protein YciS (DUF1049 family)